MIASIDGIGSTPGDLFLPASKSGLIYLTRKMAREW